MAALSVSPRAAPPHRRRPARATRQLLVRSALELFTEQGFRATTTPEIAARAGVAEATIYRHFTGKDALLNAACQDAVSWGRGVLGREHTERLIDAQSALYRIGRQLVEAAAADPALVRMLLRPPEESLHDDRTRMAFREFREGLQQIMAAGKQRGQIRSGSAELWSAVWLALAGFVAERVASRDWGIDSPNVTLALEAGWEAIAYRIPDTPVEVVT